MKGIRSSRLLNHVALMALALCFSAGSSKAQSYHGKFTLPFEARWGTTVLPAGNYTFKMPSTTSAPYAVYLQVEGRTIIIQALAVNHEEVSDHSRLTLVNKGGSRVVRTLEVGEIGTTFVYAIPKAARRQIAQDQQLLRDVPVVGK